VPILTDALHVTAFPLSLLPVLLWGGEQKAAAATATAGFSASSREPQWNAHPAISPATGGQKARACITINVTTATVDVQHRASSVSSKARQ